MHVYHIIGPGKMRLNLNCAIAQTTIAEKMKHRKREYMQAKTERGSMFVVDKTGDLSLRDICVWRELVKIFRRGMFWQPISDRLDVYLFVIRHRLWNRFFRPFHLSTSSLHFFKTQKQQIHSVRSFSTSFRLLASRRGALAQFINGL